MNKVKCYHCNKEVKRKPLNKTYHCDSCFIDVDEQGMETKEEVSLEKEFEDALKNSFNGF